MNTNKIALITGANRGLGLETARQLARDHGFTVLIGARDETKGREAETKLQSEGLDAHFLLLDATDAASVESARVRVESEFGRLDVLVNNAGAISDADYALPASVPTSALRETFDLNVFGVHEVTRAFWPLLERSDAARLVNVSSLLGSLAVQSDFDGPLKDVKIIAYDSSKAALNMMTLHYAWQWRGTTHRANAVHPGHVKTDMNAHADMEIEEGARTSVEMATIGGDGPNGSFLHLGQPVPW